MLTKNAQTVLEKRYLRKDEQGNVAETPKDLFDRVAKTLAEVDRDYGATDAQIQATRDRFMAVLTALDFLPNSPTLANAGTRTGQLSACFVLPVPDDLGGIFSAIREAALIHQTGGGTGFAFSRLRPKGDLVGSTKGVSSGPVSFMDVFNSATESIKQGGMRRGANMGILRVDHPDILEFIRHKEDLTKLTNFNISVAATDQFMQAVDRGESYNLLNPRGGEVVGTLDARMVFDEIVKRAHSTGEPGLIFIDRINATHPTPWVGDIESTNPCVTGDTWVHTNEGPRLVQDLVGRPFVARVDGKDWRSGPQGFFSTGNKQVFRLETAEGQVLRLTGNHKIRRVIDFTRSRSDADWCEVADLRPGDRVVVNDHRENASWQGSHSNEEGYLLGLLVGDGTLEADKAVLSVWKPALAANGSTSSGVDSVMEAALDAARTLPRRSDFAGWMEVSGRSEMRLSLAAVKHLAENLGMRPGGKAITPAVEQSSSSFYQGFLRGFFDSDGTIIGTQAKGISIRLAQSDLPRLQGVQRMLLRLGIASRIYQDRRPAGSSLLPDGKGGKRSYVTKAQHELVISNDNVAVFSEVVGFGDSDKRLRLDVAMAGYRWELNRERFTARIETIVPDGEETVFDVQVPGLNAFDANGLYAHNCGEQPLLPYESCNLGSINLERMIFTSMGKTEIDWERLRKTIHVATHLLDNVIDANKYPIQEIKDMTKSTRKIGLGVMGFARMLTALRVGYATAKGRALAERVMSFIDFESKVASIALAKVRGPFPAYRKENRFPMLWEARHHQPNRHPDAEFLSLLPDLEEFGIRNSCTTTVAPTGTLSIIADTSGGVEPMFALAFKRFQADTHMIEVDEPFLAEAKREGFYSERLIEEIEANHGSLVGLDGFDLPDWVSDVFVTAHDIKPEDHVLIQAAFQKYNDSATSKTINFSEDATAEEVETAYRLAYQTGCKGITVYRNNSRQFQPLSVPKALTQSKEIVTEVTEVVGGLRWQPRSRSEDLYGFTRCTTTGDGKLYTTINYDEFGMREVFTIVGRSGGTIFSLSEALGRMVSMALQHNIPVDEIANKLIGIRGANPTGFGQTKVLSIPDALGRALKEAPRQLGPVLAQQPRGAVHAMIHAPRVAAHAVEVYGESPECPECGHGLNFGEGCATCRECGFSRCS